MLTQQLASGTSHDNVFANDTVVRARLWIRDSRAAFVPSMLSWANSTSALNSRAFILVTSGVMRDIFALVLHVIVTIIRLAQPRMAQKLDLYLGQPKTDALA